ncbi:TetR/AcrR family transcriptional regulator [Companilactobacillus furfuricola]|uniref:TetR/AcrR family transcriptional regulator n=1 Tax=Companilactobacillus furfuricola TaxID=1462575 RepID=UPI000F7B7E8C|nr:TetR/AcrR family transcriptional regulator [Companilactobacillus furfuricola]
MTSLTFKNLDNTKKQLIENVLLDEFSQYTLPTAKVSRIVKAANIARGAFYKYFDDINDAYRYIYGQAIQQIHADFRIPSEQSNSDYLTEVKNFVERIDNSKYYELMKMHISSNEAFLASQSESFDQKIDPNKMDDRTWIMTVLSHEIIKEILLDPKKKDFWLTRYSNILQQLGEK